MKVYSFWRCAGSAGVYLSVESGKDTKMSETVTILYCGKPVSAPKEVADFLEQDRKREQAQTRQDTRHLSRSEFETVLSGQGCVRRPTEDEVLRNLQLENLQEAIKKLDAKDQSILDLRYSEDLTMEEIGKVYGVSKMAVSLDGS